MTICRLVLAISNTCRFGALVSLSAFHFQGVKEFCTEDDRKIEESVSDVHRRPREIGRPSVPLVVAEGVCLPPGCQRKIQKERRPGRFAGLPLADEEGDVARAEIAAREPGRVVKSCLSRLGAETIRARRPAVNGVQVGGAATGSDEGVSLGPSGHLDHRLGSCRRTAPFICGIPFSWLLSLSLGLAILRASGRIEPTRLQFLPRSARPTGVSAAGCG